MPVINGVYLKDFTALPGAVADADIIPIAISGDQIAYRTTVAGIVTDARITAKLLTGLSVTGGAVVAADTILAAFGKVQSQINGKQGTITLTTTGTSGAATFSANTLNIPNYADSFVGTVTSVAALTLGTTGSDLSSTVANGTTTPVITLQVPTASASNRGALSSADWTTFNNKAAALSGTINTIAYWDSSTTIASLALATYPSLTELSYVKGVTSAIQTQLNAKQATITLTTTGTSGAATFSANTLNIPQYQASGTYVTSVTGTSPIVSSGGTTPAISIPVATTLVNGYLSSTDWTTFNGKQATITLTTTGTSGAATFSSNTLNIPNYADGGVLSLSVIGAVPNANAATITGTVLNLQPADGSFGGVVTTGTQTFAGAKTFTGALAGTTATFSGLITLNSTSSQHVILNNTAANGGYQEFDQSGTAFGYIGNSKSFITSGTLNDFAIRAQNNFVISTGGGTAVLTIASTGAATFNSTATATAFIPSGATVPTNGMYLSAANTLDFATNTTNRLTITSGGLVGIGVTPNAWFTSGGYKVLQIAAGLSLDSGNDFRARLAANAYVNTSGDWVYANTGFASNYNQSSGTHVWETAPSGVAGNAITFTERMRITSGGNVLIGTTTDNGNRLQAVGSGTVASFNDTSSGDVTITLLANGTFRGGLGADANYALKITGVGATQVAVINTSTGVYTATSDRTLKKNISDSPLALPVLNQIKIRQYNWNSDNSVEQYGVIAQELYEVAPTYVSKPKKETDKWGVSKAELVPLLIKAIQEQQTQIQELKALIK